MEVAKSHRAPTFAAAVALALLCLDPGCAYAQSAGNGVKVGEGRLHPTVDVEARYDSAAGVFRGSDGVLALSAEALTHVRPKLAFELPSPTLALSLNGEVDFVNYSGLVTPGSQSASRIEGGANLHASINAEGNVRFELSDVFRRSDKTSNVAVGVGVLSLSNEMRGAAIFKPGGGALELEPAIGFSLESFDPISGQFADCLGQTECPQVATNNYRNLQGALSARWRFLPKTALVLETTYDRRSYSNASDPPASLLRSVFGLAGLVTPRIAVATKLGYGHNFGSGGGGGLLAQAEATYLVSEESQFKLGYVRNLVPIPLHGLFVDDRAFAEARYRFGPRLMLRATSSYDWVRFDGASPRYDRAFGLDLAPEYALGPWLTAAVGWVVNSRSSSLDLSSLNFRRHELYVRLSATY